MFYDNFEIVSLENIANMTNSSANRVSTVYWLRIKMLGMYNWIRIYNRIEEKTEKHLRLQWMMLCFNEHPFNSVIHPMMMIINESQAISCKTAAQIKIWCNFSIACVLKITHKTTALYKSCTIFDITRMLMRLHAKKYSSLVSHCQLKLWKKMK